jgi:hypothetical protein
LSKISDIPLPLSKEFNEKEIVVLFPSKICDIVLLAGYLKVRILSPVKEASAAFIAGETPDSICMAKL